MAAHTYPADALFADRTQEPTGGVPSLTDGEISQVYTWWIGRPPDSGEMASERGNALKYSAAGIERQIANRAGNVAGSGVRGDEGAAPLTIAAPIPAASSGNMATMGPSAIYANGPTAGPVGLMTGGYYGGGAAPYYGGAAPAFGGLSLTTLAIIAAALGAAIYFMRK